MYMVIENKEDGLQVLKTTKDEYELIVLLEKIAKNNGYDISTEEGMQELYEKVDIHFISGNILTPWDFLPIQNNIRYKDKSTK